MYAPGKLILKPYLQSTDVSRNAQSAQKELQAAEAKLNSASSSISPEAPVANGQPVIEIREELDEEGNVICMCGRRYANEC